VALRHACRPTSRRYHLVGNADASHTGFTGQQGAGGAIEQRDAADEGRLEPCGGIVVGNKVIVNEGAVVRPSQLIASVRRTRGEGNR
jgi:adenylosuccinate synthase